jgi:hypothetical protein
MQHEVSLFAEFDLARLWRARRFGLFGGLARHSRALAYWLAAAIVMAGYHTAAAHGIAGNRYFVGTLTFDDPSVADEAIVPFYSAINYPAPGGNVAENRIHWAFDRLLTPTLAVTYDSGWIHQNWPTGKTSGLDTTNIGLKYETYRDNRHEALVSVGVAWGIGQSGAQAVGADEPNTIQPGIFFGKGFGDLPDWLTWVRPFAITGAVVDAIPFGPTGKALTPNPAKRQFSNRPRPASKCAALGLFAPIQHLLSDQPIYRRAAERRAAQSVRALGRVQFRHTVRTKHGRHHESGLRLRGGRLADRGRSDRAAQPPRRQRTRRPRATDVLHRRSHPVRVRQAAVER